MESRKETVMKNSWKLCVAAGSFMMFAVLGVLVILGHTTSSADSEQKTFQTSQSVTGGGVTGESVTDNGITDKSVSGGSITDKGAKGTDEATKKRENELPEKDAAKADDSEGDSTNIQASVGKVMEPEEVEDQSLGAEIAYYARRFLGIRYVYGGTDLPSIESITYCYFNAGKKGDATDSAAIEEANKKIFGGEYGVDSSGFVKTVFSHFGIKLPRSCAKQAEEGKDILIKVKDVQPGDILFYGTSDNKITHCGIYVGDGKVVHASSQKKMVTMSDMNYRRIVKVKRAWS